MQDIRGNILKHNILEFPTQIIKLLKCTTEQVYLCQEFFNNLWHKFLLEEPLYSLYWADKFNDEIFFYRLIRYLATPDKLGLTWISSVVNGTEALIYLHEDKILKWLSPEELSKLRFDYKLNQHTLTNTQKPYDDSLVAINNTIKQTGLVRKGFFKAGHNKFRYDVTYLKKYKPEVIVNVLKGLEASTKDITYEEIAEDLVDNYIAVNGTYILGQCIMDSRGRSIFEASRKIFNPVSNKVARASLIGKNEPLKEHALPIIFQAICELLGNKTNSVYDNIELGKQCYENRVFPILNDDTLFEVIWLERIYANLHKYFTTSDKTWNVPIELDVTSSVIAILGVILNSEEYLDLTNLIYPDELKDAWTIEGVPRKAIKKTVTPRVYGSSAPPIELLMKAKIKVSQDMINTITKELETGRYALANDFKNHIIEYVKPQPSMKVKIHNEEFTIECNKFNYELVSRKEYNIFTTAQNLVKTVTRESTLVPDLNQFKRYFVTLLI